jgi:hypothetical protein
VLLTLPAYRLIVVTDANGKMADEVDTLYAPIHA